MFYLKNCFKIVPISNLKRVTSIESFLSNDSSEGSKYGCPDRDRESHDISKAGYLMVLIIKQLKVQSLGQDSQVDTLNKLVHL